MNEQIRQLRNGKSLVWRGHPGPNQTIYSQVVNWWSFEAESKAYLVHEVIGSRQIYLILQDECMTMVLKMFINVHSSRNGIWLTVDGSQFTVNHKNK